MAEVYIDTSAYLSILLAEDGHESVLHDIDESPLCSSSFMILEAERTLIHLTREKHLSEDNFQIAMEALKNDVPKISLLDFNPSLCLTGFFPAVLTPRSSDLVHLRSALWFHQNFELKYFISLDLRQTKAAVELGLPVRK